MNDKNRPLPPHCSKDELQQLVNIDRRLISF